MINQTIQPNEIIIIEDGPLTNALYTVLDEYEARNPQIILRYKNQTNLGLGLALNNGLQISHNELVARMDTDDISKP